MKTNVCISIWGEGYDPNLFNDTLPNTMQGEVRTTKKVRNGKVFPGEKYWKSFRIEVEPENYDPEKVLYDLVSRYSSTLKNLKDKKDVTVYGKLEISCKSIDELNGFYFDTSFMKLLSSLNVNLDIGIGHQFDG